LKSKLKLDEILPPPPPVPGGEYEEPELKLEEKPKPGFFQRILKPRETKPEISEESKAFKALLTELDKEFETKNIGTSIESQKPKKKLSKKELKRAKLKEKKQLKIKTKKSDVFDIPDLEEDFELKDLDFTLPKELEQAEEFELTETLGIDLEQEAQKPEVIEAQKEIKSAIEKIKSTETRRSLFQRLFTKKAQGQKKDEILIPEIPETDDFSRINNSINRARQALMNFDLEAAKKNYIEALKLYNNLKPEDQAKTYEELKELYFERKSAEELKV